MGTQSVGKNGAAGAGRTIMERVSHHSRIALEFFHADVGHKVHPSSNKTATRVHLSMQMQILAYRRDDLLIVIFPGITCFFTFVLAAQCQLS